MNKLRLLLFETCNRSCPGCCNADWDLADLPKIQDYHGYDTILLTGGEPMLDPALILNTVRDIRAQSHARIYLYTAMLTNTPDVLAILDIVDGLTVTLHEQQDLQDFKILNAWLAATNVNQESLLLSHKSLRLNVFRGIDLGRVDLSRWRVKTDIVWIKDCPLPQDEVFKRLS